jgi:hypothetical protein
VLEGVLSVAFGVMIAQPAPAEAGPASFDEMPEFLVEFLVFLSEEVIDVAAAETHGAPFILDFTDTHISVEWVGHFAGFRCFEAD